MTIWNTVLIFSVEKVFFCEKTSQRKSNEIKPIIVTFGTYIVIVENVNVNIICIRKVLKDTYADRYRIRNSRNKTRSDKWRFHSPNFLFVLFFYFFFNCKHRLTDSLDVMQQKFSPFCEQFKPFKVIHFFFSSAREAFDCNSPCLPMLSFENIAI